MLILGSPAPWRQSTFTPTCLNLRGETETLGSTPVDRPSGQSEGTTDANLTLEI